MTEFQRIYRQGDVIVFQLPSPQGETRSGQATDQVVLALGEVTGHAHRLRGGIELLEPDRGDGRCLFRVTDQATLTHEEHATMVFEPGLYLKVNQVEYDPFTERIRHIAD